MLSRFLTCRERFRIRVIEGWRPVEKFNHKIEYGNMWHVLEETLASFNGEEDEEGRQACLEDDLAAYCQQLAAKYKGPGDRSYIRHWSNVCLLQFQEYVKFWSIHPDVSGATPLMAEQVLDVPYQLPSGRVVRLRCKIDRVDLVDSVWVQENKTKGDIDLVALQSQMTNDLQSMMYLVILQTHRFPEGVGKGKPDLLNAGGAALGGIRYNVVRRPLSGGKGSITQKKGSKNVAPETDQEFYDRLQGLIATANGPDWGVADDENFFFARLNVPVSESDIKRFRERTLDPILEAVCNWYDIVTENPIGTLDRSYNFSFGHNWLHPYGITNTIDEYGASDLDHYINEGSTVGLEKVTTLFRELEV